MNVIRSLLLLIWSGFSAPAQIAFHSDLPSTTLERSIDAVLWTYAGTDAYEERKQAFAEVIIPHATEAIPVLERLFQSNLDGYYRAAALEALWGLEGGPVHAIRLMEKELSKEPAQWDGSIWVFQGLLLLPGENSESARNVAYRVLEASTDRLIFLPAARIFENIGVASDIPRLQLLVEDWQHGATPSNLHQVGVRWLQAAIAKIQERVRSVSGTMAPEFTRSIYPPASAAPSVSLLRDTTKAISVDSESSRDYGARILWVVGIGLAAVIIVVIVRRRFG